MSSLVSQNPTVNGLTKYPVASLRELIVLSFPIVLTLVCTNLTNFCDRIFLSYYSHAAFNGCVSASFLCLLFQISAVRLVSIAQVFVSKQKGEGAPFIVGAYVWQMIWFSIFSLALTLPVSIWMAPYYFLGTSIQESGMLYFHGMMYANFLFPLGAALSSFFIGLGKSKIIFWSMLISQGIHLLLDYLLIFGIQGYLQPLGVLGATIATIFNQLLFCSILLVCFLKKSNRDEYGTANYRVQWSLLWESLKLGLPSALGKLSTLCAWAAISKIMISKGGSYLDVLTIGSSFALLFLFINEGIGKALTTVASYIIGSKQWDRLLGVLSRSTLKFVGLLSIILFVPFVLLPNMTLTFFVPSQYTSEELYLLGRSFMWVWVYAITNGISFLGVALQTASRQTFFYMIVCNASWITYFIVFYGMNNFHWLPDKLWLVMACDSLLTGITNIVWAKRAGKVLMHTQTVA